MHINKLLDKEVSLRKLVADSDKSRPVSYAHALCLLYGTLTGCRQFQKAVSKG